jgi:hypothetical protein
MWFAPGLITPDWCRRSRRVAFTGPHPIGVSLSQPSLGKIGGLDASWSHLRVHSRRAADGQRPTREDLRMASEEAERRSCEACRSLTSPGPQHDEDADVGIGQLTLFDLADSWPPSVADGVNRPTS